MKNILHIELPEHFFSYPGGYKPACGAPGFSIAECGINYCMSYTYLKYNIDRYSPSFQGFCKDCLNHPKIVFLLFSEI